MAVPATNGSGRMAVTGEPFVTRMRVRNFKSIASCDVRLRRFAVIVGRNAAGKSNFLDALRFVADAVDVTPDHAIKARGGIDAVRRTSTGHPRNFALSLDLRLPGGVAANYGFEIAARKGGGFIVKREVAGVAGGRTTPSTYMREDELLYATGEAEGLRAPASDRLLLVNASGLAAFRPLYDGLRAMGFYNLNPDVMKRPQPPDAGELLHADGSNIASVIGRLGDEGSLGRLREFLRVIVPDVEDLERVSLGPTETLKFRQRVAGSKSAWSFFAGSMSDGTMRALGLLTAVMQLASGRQPATLVGVEEPETALHPAAAGALVDALREAAEHTQVIVTCHSPDLLDAVDVESEQLLAVQAEAGTTRVAPVDAASLQALRNHLFTAGELLRMDQLHPDPHDLRRQEAAQLDLFAAAGGGEA